MIDLAIWLMGNPTPVAVTGSTYCKFADNDVSDSVLSDFGDMGEDGTAGNLALTYAIPIQL